jgi:hypothetical protein
MGDRHETVAVASGDRSTVVSAYRVFVSYSGQDRELVEKITVVLKENGLRPMWMGEFTYIHDFPEQIKTCIAHAHVFMPVITPSSSSRGWVHQEIGYALALNVPFFCISKGALPAEMMQQLNALVLDESSDVQTDIEKLRLELSKAKLERIAERWKDKKYALHVCADDPPQRADMMTKYADDVRSMGEFGCVRQKGALSSFHIPDKSITHGIWRQRYGGFDRGDFHCTHQLHERIALEKHAKEEGCRLIIDPSIEYDQWGAHARKVRLETLVEFLRSDVGEKAQVAINRKMARGQSLTLVGDWFAAESVSGTIQGGYKQTIFTRHAPSVVTRVESFDREFAELLAEAGWSAETSRASALERLDDLIEKIARDLREP